MLRWQWVIAALGVAGLVSGSAGAGSIGAADLGSSIGGIALIAHGGQLKAKQGGIGISGGAHRREIDTRGEMLEIQFDEDSGVDYLKIKNLYGKRQKGDRVNEAVRIVTDTGPCAGDGCVFKAKRNGFAWNGEGDVQKMGRGRWLIENPFGAAEVSHMTLQAEKMRGTGRNARNSDFFLAKLGWTPGSPAAVPEPGTAVLLALGLAGLAFASRRRRA